MEVATTSAFTSTNGESNDPENKKDSPGNPQETHREPRLRKNRNSSYTKIKTRLNLVSLAGKPPSEAMGKQGALTI